MKSWKNIEFEPSDECPMANVLGSERMMKKVNVWGVFYPFFMYYLVSSFVFFALNILWGENRELYMLKQAISSLSTIPFLIFIWKQDGYVEKVVYGEQKVQIGKYIGQAVLAGVSVGAVGVALNNFIAMTPFVQVSAGFQSANENFFAGEVVMQILASCVVVPIAEELLFRGIILKRVSLLTGERIGILFSAILFGVIHMNLVQFLYAFVVGILLAMIVAKTRWISLAMIGHSIANLIAILRASSGVLDFSYQLTLAGIGFSIGMMVLGIGAMMVLIRVYCNEKNSKKVTKIVA